MDQTWLLDHERTLVNQYQRLKARFEQVQKEWTVVPFHWGQVDIDFLTRAALAFEALAAKEAEWRMVQYNLHWATYQEHKDSAAFADLAEQSRDHASTFLRESNEWRQEATDSRLWRQAIERARAAYLAYQEQERVKMEAYQALIAPAG